MEVRFLISAFVAVGAVFSQSVFAVDKFCSTPGVYYCALGSGYPDRDNNCGVKPLDGIIKGVNYIPMEMYPDAIYEPWHYRYSVVARYTEQRLGKSEKLIYWEGRYRAGWVPAWKYNAAEVSVYNCKLCPPGSAPTASNTCSVQSGADGTQPPPPPINNGGGQNNTCNPINISTGNKYYRETDYSDGSFEFSRYFNSSTKRWSFSYTQKLYLNSLSGKASMQGADGSAYYPHEIWAFHEDGKVTTHDYAGNSNYEYLSKSNGELERVRLENPAFNTTLVNNKGSYYLRGPDGFLIFENSLPVTPGLGNTHKLINARGAEWYDIFGRLTKIEPMGQAPAELTYIDNMVVVTRHGKTITLTTGKGGRVERAALPDGSEIKYVYAVTTGVVDPLVTVTRTFSDSTDVVLRRYFYEDTRFPALITGVEDENGNRISSVHYDSVGRAISSEKGPLNSGVERTQVQYHANGTRTLINALGKQSTHHFIQINGENKLTKIVGHPSANCAAAYKEITYNSKGLVLSRTDWQGNTTSYTYNERGLESSRTEAYGTPSARAVITEWHPTLLLPVAVTEPTRITTYTYDAQGRQLSQSVTQH